MEIIKVEDPQAVSKAVKVLQGGGVILYPTDTLYGLGADATSREAIATIYTIKGRHEKKPLHAIVTDMDMANAYGEVNEKAFALACAFLPGPLTLVLRKHADVYIAMSEGRDEFAIRIPDNQFCLELARQFGKPYTTTSANESGKEPARTVENILAQLGDRASMIDLVIDAAELPERLPSTIVDVTMRQARIIREGAIPASDILHSL
ncbi:MAG: L-threonylcarbamoyladenylate synthase [Minisyncoccia bacterium]